MTSYQSIDTPQDYVNYTFNISSRGVTEVAGEMAGLSNTVTTILGQLAFKTSEYLTHTESLIIGLGTASVAAFASSTKEAIRFEQAIANVQAIGGESINAMEIGQAAMRYSSQFGMDVNSMTEGLEALSRAGLTATNVMSGVLAEGVKLSKLEGMDLEDSINDLISTTNLLAENDIDVNTQEYANAVKQMNQHIVSTSESAPINAQNIIQTLQHVGGYASANKIDQDDLFAVIAQLGAKGTKGEMAGTALRAFIAAGQKDQAQRALKRIGLSPSDLWDESGDIMLPVSEVKSILDDALEKRGYSQQEKLEFYSDFAGYKQANQIMKIDTSEVQEYKETIAQAWDLGKKLETILGTTHNNIQTLFQTVKNFMTRVGSTLLPVINAIVIPIKWGVQLLDAMPFSENITGMLLAFVGLKAAVLFINRVVPSIATLYTSFSSSEKKAKGIYGHFKNLKKELEQSKEILSNIADKEYLNKIRLKQGLMGRQSHLQHKDITQKLYENIFLRENDDALDWKELSSTQKELYYSITETLKHTDAYQDIIDQFNKSNEEHANAFIDAINGIVKEEPESNRDKNKKKNIERESSVIVKTEDYQFAAQKNLEQASQHVDEVATSLEKLQEGTQYDIGKSILSIKEPLAEAIGRAVAQSLQAREVQVSETLGSFQINGRKAPGAIKQLQEIESEVSVDLGDIGYFLDYDIGQIDSLMAQVRGDLQRKITAYQNDNPLFINDTQIRRMEKSISGLAKTKLGTMYSAEQNSIDILDVLKYGKVKEYKNKNIGIHEQQMNAIEKALGMDNQSGVERTARLNNIHKYLRNEHQGTKAQKENLIKEVLKITEDIWLNKISHDNPGVEASKFLTSDIARYIGNKVGIAGIDWNQIDNPAQQLIEYFKDTKKGSNKDRQLKQADRLMFTFLEGEKSQGDVFNAAEAQEIGYLIRRYRQLLEARVKALEKQNKNSTTDVLEHITHLKTSNNNPNNIATFLKNIKENTMSSPDEYLGVFNSTEQKLIESVEISKKRQAAKERHATMEKIHNDIKNNISHDLTVDVPLSQKFDQVNKRIVFYPEEINDVMKSSYDWQRIPTAENASDRIKDLLKNGIFEIDNNMSELGASIGGNIKFNMNNIIDSVLQAHLMPKIFEVFTHEIGHSLLQHILRDSTITNLPSNLIIPGPLSEQGEKWRSPISEYEAMTVSKKMANIANIPLPKGFLHTYKELEELIKKDYGGLDNVNFDLINETVRAMSDNMIDIISQMYETLLPDKSNLAEKMGVSHITFLEDILNADTLLREQSKADIIKQISRANRGYERNDTDYQNTLRKVADDAYRENPNLQGPRALSNFLSDEYQDSEDRQQIWKYYSENLKKQNQQQSSSKKSNIDFTADVFNQGIEKILKKIDNLVSVDAINIQTALLDRLKVSLGDKKYYEELEKLKATNEQNIRATDAGQEKEVLDEIRKTNEKIEEQNQKFNRIDENLQALEQNQELMTKGVILMTEQMMGGHSKFFTPLLESSQKEYIPTLLIEADTISNITIADSDNFTNTDFSKFILPLERIMELDGTLLVDNVDNFFVDIINKEVISNLVQYMMADFEDAIINGLLSTTVISDPDRLLSTQALTPTNKITSTLYPLSAVNPNILFLPSGAGQSFQQPFPNFMSNDEIKGALIQLLDKKINTLVDIFKQTKKHEADIKKELLNISKIITKRYNIQKHIEDTNRRLAGAKYRESIAKNQYFEPIGPIEKEPTVYKTIALTKGGQYAYEKAYRNYNYKETIGPQPAPGFIMPQYKTPIGPPEDKSDLAKLRQSQIIEEEKRRRKSQQMSQDEVKLQARIAIEEEERTKRYNKKMAQRKAINDKRAAESARRFREQNQLRNYLFNQAEEFLQSIDDSEQELIHLYELYGTRITHNYDVIKEINQDVVKLQPPRAQNQSSIEEYKSFAPGFTQYYQYKNEKAQQQEQKQKQQEQKQKEKVQRQEQKQKEKEQKLLAQHNYIEAKRAINKIWSSTKGLRVFGGVIANNGAIQGPRYINYTEEQEPKLPSTNRDFAQAAIARLKERKALEDEQKHQEEERKRQEIIDKEYNKKLIDIVDKNYITKNSGYIPTGFPGSLTGLEQARFLKENKAHETGLAIEEITKFYQEQERLQEEEYNRGLEIQNQEIQKREEEHKRILENQEKQAQVAKEEARIQKEKEQNALREKLLLDELKRKFDTGLYQLTDEELVSIGKAEYSTNPNSKARADALQEKRRKEQEKLNIERARQFATQYTGGYDAENKPDITAYQDKVKEEKRKQEQIEKNKYIAQQQISQYSSGYDVEKISDIDEYRYQTLLKTKPEEVLEGDAFWNHIKKMEQDAAPSKIEQANAAVDRYKKHQETIQKQMHYQTMKEVEAMDGLLIGFNKVADEAEKISKSYKNPMREKDKEFWKEQDKLAESALEELEIAQQLGPGMLHTMRHQLGVDKVEKERENQKLKEEAKQYQHVKGVGVGVTGETEAGSSEALAKRVRSQYSHISGVGVNANYEGMSDVEKATMKADHRYGKVSPDREQSRAERAERFGIKIAATKEWLTNELPNKSINKLSSMMNVKEGDENNDLFGKTSEKLNKINTELAPFNEALFRAGEIFPPFTIAAVAMQHGMEGLTIASKALWFADQLRLVLMGEEHAATEGSIAAKMLNIVATWATANAEEGLAAARIIGQIQTWLATTAETVLAAIRAFIAGPLLLPVIAILAVIAAAIATVYFWEKQHADALKKSQEELKEATAKNNAALSQYKDLKKARESETDAIKKQQKARKEAIALYELEAARVKKRALVQKEAEARNDAVWGEYGLRASLQKMGLGFIAGGDFKSQYEEYDGTTKNIRQIKEETLGNIFATSSQRQVASFYDNNSRFFAEVEAYKEPLQELYDKESKLIEKYGSIEDARASKEFHDAVQEFADATGINGKTAGMMLDWLETENRVNQATTAMQATASMIVAEADANAMKAMYPELDTGAEGFAGVQDAMIMAQAESIYKDAYDQMWWNSFGNKLWGYFNILLAVLDPLGIFGNHMEQAQKHFGAAEAYDEGMQNLVDVGINGLYEQGEEAAKNAERRDYGLGTYSIYGDTPFGGAKRAAASEHADRKQQQAYAQNGVIYSEEEYQQIQDDYQQENYGVTATQQEQEARQNYAKKQEEKQAQQQAEVEKRNDTLGQLQTNGEVAHKDAQDIISAILGNPGAVSGAGAGILSLTSDDNPLMKTLRKRGMKDIFKFMAGEEDTLTGKVIGRVKPKFEDAKVAYADEGFSGLYKYGKGIASKGVDKVKGGLSALKSEAIVAKDVYKLTGPKGLVGYGKGALSNSIDAIKNSKTFGKITDRIALARETNALAADGVPIARNGIDKAVGLFDGAKAAYAEDSWRGLATFGKNTIQGGAKGIPNALKSGFAEAGGLQGIHASSMGQLKSAFSPKALAGGVDDIARGLRGGGSLMKGIGKIGGPALMALGPALAFADKASELNPFEGKHYNEDGTEKKALQATGEVVGTTAGAVGGVVGGLEGAAAGAIVGQALIPIPGVGAAIGAVAGGIAGGWLGDTIFQPIGEAIGGTIGWLGDNLLGGIQDVAGTVWDGLTGAAGGVWDAVSGAATGVWDFLTGNGENNNNPVKGILGLTPIGMGINAAAGIWDWLSGDNKEGDPYANVEAATGQKIQKSHNKSETTIVIKNININTEDDPEKIKSAFMNLMIELQEQISPRQVSRTIGEPPAVSTDASTDTNNQDQAEGTDQNNPDENSNNTNPTT